MDKNIIKIKDNEGAIIIRDDGIPEIHPPLDFSDESDNVRFTLAFLLYAADKKDWVEEFNDFVEQLESKLSMTESEINALERRSMFRIVEEDE